eukprot:8337308-Ditylum_brightwellii.AAC.1
MAQTRKTIRVVHKNNKEGSTFVGSAPCSKSPGSREGENEKKEGKGKKKRKGKKTYMIHWKKKIKTQRKYKRSM